ncbi:MAG: HAD family hydrolase [Carbonactinosporaceae bacterium]
MPERQLRVLIVDWGGVLTTLPQDSMVAWAEGHGIDYGQFRRVMREWLGQHAGAEAVQNPIFALERGEIEVPHFEEQLAARLHTLDGGPVPAEGLLARMFAHFEHAPDMSNVVRRARRAGLRTALLSNSWGNEYPRDGWDEMFDVVVISGEVGMRKPEPEIFWHTLSALGCRPEEAVFVDDLPHNVRGAAELGIVGVHHRSYDETVAELEALFGTPLRG